MSDRMSASDGILMRLVVPDPANPLACPWGLLTGRDGPPCDGHGCALCMAAESRAATRHAGT